MEGDALICVRLKKSVNPIKIFFFISIMKMICFLALKKIPISKYDYAVKLCGKENADFLYKVSKTTSDRDIAESFYAKAF